VLVTNSNTNDLY